MHVFSRPTRLAFATAVLVVVTSSSAIDATAQGGDGSDTDGSRLQVALITVGPGRFVWERFGHNALWVRDTTTGFSTAYNYGMFSFQQENFLLRFVRGRMLYWTAGFDAQTLIDHYMSQNRSVWIQELNLQPEQKKELRDFLAWNERPENKFYLYNYYRDNCSTRLRDAIDAVLQGAVRAQTESINTDKTYRFHTRRLTEHDLPIYTGLLLGLGQPVDRDISVWEEMFLPMKLRDHLRMVTVTGPDSQPAPLIASERTVFTSAEAPPPASPTTRLLLYGSVGVVVAIVFVALGNAARHSRLATVGFVSLGATWSLVVGVLGMLLMVLWALTDHDTSYRNENLLLFNPVHLALGICLPLAALGVEWSRRATGWLAAAAFGLTALGFALQLLPPFFQVNGELFALMLPPTMALGIGVLWLMSRWSAGDLGEERLFHRPRSWQ